MTELYRSGSTSNSPFQTQLPHMCNRADSPGNAAKSEAGRPERGRKKKEGLYLRLLK